MAKQKKITTKVSYGKVKGKPLTAQQKAKVDSGFKSDMGKLAKNQKSAQKTADGMWYGKNK